MERHHVWWDIRHRLIELEKSAPEGHQPVVEVYLAGREAPVVPSHIETSRDSEYPWVVLHVTSAGDEPSETRSPDEYLVHVSESMIARVETKYVAKGDRPPVTIGFSQGEVAEPREPDDETERVEMVEPPPVFPITPRDVSVERDT
jgi:hypothetical protein